jgi:hypothetical protein
MTTNYYLARVGYTTVSSVLDNPSIDLAYQATDATTDPLDIANAVKAALNVALAGASQAAEAYLAKSISRGTNTASCKVYNVTGHLDGSAHGGPSVTQFWTPHAIVNQQANPEGLCVEMSFEASYTGYTEFGPISAIPTPPDIIADYGAAATHQGRTRPRSRRRGRVFYGPIDGGFFSYEATTNRCVWNSQTLTDFGKILQALGTITLTSGTSELCVWSRRDAAYNHALEGLIPDRPAYQRRRVDPTVVKTVVTLNAS